MDYCCVQDLEKVARSRSGLVSTDLKSDLRGKGDDSRLLPDKLLPHLFLPVVINPQDHPRETSEPRMRSHFDLDHSPDSTGLSGDTWMDRSLSRTMSDNAKVARF